MTIPRAGRYAIHKLIVAASRVDQTKAPKDILQAHTLIQALSTLRPAELKRAWTLAWESGNRCRQKLQAGRQRLPAESQAILRELSPTRARSNR